jgi:hypothetical protein
LFEYLTTRPQKPGPTPQVTSLYFEVDCCVRFLKMPYSEFASLPPIIRRLYRYYFMMRSYLEEEEDERRKKEENKRRQLDMMEASQKRGTRR